MLFKLLPTAEWAEASTRGRYCGSAVDIRDGYIHLSARDQVVETARRHFSGQPGLTLLTVDPDRLGDELRWEVSRGGALFPHLYCPLSATAVVAAHVLPDEVDVADAVAEVLTAR